LENSVRGKKWRTYVTGTGIVGGPMGLTTQGNNEAFHSRRAEPTRWNTEESEERS